MAMPLNSATQMSSKQILNSEFILHPLPTRPSKAVFCAKSKSRPRLEVHASLKEKAVAGLTIAALTASMVMPDVAEAAVFPSLKNFLLSIVAGGVVLGAIVGAIVAVANFDPVKRS
ncbi:uncharacterized protein LOC8258568 [Ricinus communis]|uniref:Ultraviolet-B-repressible protein n=1 Tax=Ricinus communis TaxID=3988 RepID=B9RQV2_RICCO|nr:uncharacterized protein LOC8258568 [Ricinus communis]EEF46123.1 conserved hypothetical protein [Ricinus communis]|eukprot:XP_002516121.1 uncharacterized protein LOC8258568 [Ricinus communis]